MNSHSVVLVGVVKWNAQSRRLVLEEIDNNQSWSYLKQDVHLSINVLCEHNNEGGKRKEKTFQNPK